MARLPGSACRGRCGSGDPLKLSGVTCPRSPRRTPHVPWGSRGRRLGGWSDPEARSAARYLAPTRRRVGRSPRPTSSASGSTQTGPGLFRYSADGTFAGYLPENLEREPILAGTWEVRGRGERIRLSYESTTIPGCTPGEVTVMESELIEFDVGVALRTKVLRSCGDILPPPVQVRVSPR